MTADSYPDTLPVLAVAGHPNKGKSSIVSTLAQDCSVQVSPHSGTTLRCREYPIQLDGRVLCRLLDTPGFQRPRAVLSWVQQHSESSADRTEAITGFLNAHRDDPDYSAEVQILTPILAGAGILYVINGSVPYGSHYDAEMEILRWTGRPSMALINRIGPGDYTDDWKNILTQHFQIVREFNALSEPFEQQVQMLTGFAVLHEPWSTSLREATESLVARRQYQLEQSCLRIAKLLEDVLLHTDTADLDQPKDETGIALGRESFLRQLVHMEQAARLDVERIFNHDNLGREESDLPHIDEDLFSEQTWRLFGLKKDQLLVMGAAGGAATGSVIDVGTFGYSLFLGSLAGAVIGVTGVWLGSRQLIRVRIKGLPLGGHQAILGPVTDIQFPWVVLGRAFTHLYLVSVRSHAIREQLKILHDSGEALTSGLDAEIRNGIQKRINLIRRKSSIRSKQRKELGRLLLTAFNDMIKSGLATHVDKQGLANSHSSG